MTRARPLLLASALALAALTALAASRVEVARERPYDFSGVPSSRVLRWLSLGHPALMANLYYLRAVQYVGDARANQRGWDKLYPVLDLVTDLDPRHGYAYQVGGTLLGTVNRVAASNALLEKGMRNVPGRYILPYLRAFNAFYYANDYAAAGRFTEIAARTPGAPEHLRASALAWYVKGGEADAAIQFLQNVREAAHDVESRKAIDEQLRQAWLERGAAAVDAAAEAFQQARGRRPDGAAELVREGFLRALPPDPFEGRWVLGQDGRAYSSAHAFRYSRPDRQRRAAEPGIKDRE